MATLDQLEADVSKAVNAVARADVERLQGKLDIVMRVVADDIRSAAERVDWLKAFLKDA